ncbi:MAG: HAMP domain-containing protein [Deltaproteobacteria bacterium]|nr:HAMP domain-containing protein [Deltaproteobacteria bacterium]
MDSATPTSGTTKKRARPGLRVQIMLGMTAVTLVAILTTGYIALWAAGDSLRVQREAMAATLAASVSRSVAADWASHGQGTAADKRASLRSVLRSLHESTGAIGLSVLDMDRGEIASWPPRRDGDRDAIVLSTALAGGPPVVNYRQEPHGRETELLAYAPIEVAGQLSGAVRVTIAAAEPTQAVLRRSGWVLLLLAIADALLVLGLGLFVLTQLVVRPLGQLRRATAAMAAGDLEPRIPEDGPKEFAALASAFNQMTVSLAVQREQIIRTEKLASVGQLAAGVAHEIGNPLAAILGYIDILRADAAGKGELPPAERQDTLDRVKAETQRIHRIIRELLEFSRPSHEEPVATDARRVVQSAQALLAPQSRFRDVRLVLAGGESWPRVLVSPGRLAQVLVNLLLNAADAMAGKGTIVVTCEEAEGKVVLTIADEGPGVTPENQRKIFDPFFTTKVVGQGTGLGLSVSRSIVESFGGTLEIAPFVEGQGAKFVLTLPRGEGAWRCS